MKLTLSNKTYDVLVWIAQLLLPALGTLYFTLSGIWGFPYGEQVIGTLTAIDVFLGAILGISSSNYEGDGVMHIDDSDPDKDVYSLDLNYEPEELAKKKTITFKVKNSSNG